ncbi:DUF4190 domain-containing protein [Luethyella okanaganae]|uniref:DUF4190 domain-containing protein n=1 Tax=Luethyella okanaganae TaxID=69372 RepID=A0ABW1VH98_9MICO
MSATIPAIPPAPADPAFATAQSGLQTSGQPDFAGPVASVQEETKGFSISSLVLGLVSIVAGWTFLAPIVGLVAGIMALSREPSSRTIAIWGIVLNSVMLGGSLLVGIAAFAFGLALLPFAFL